MGLYNLKPEPWSSQVAYRLVQHKLHQIEEPDSSSVSKVPAENFGIEFGLGRLHRRRRRRSWAFWVRRQAMVLRCWRSTACLWSGLLLRSHYRSYSGYFIVWRLWLGR